LPLNEALEFQKDIYEFESNKRKDHCKGWT
jgi:hypothetical protein